jgi:hypothetical protein
VCRRERASCIQAGAFAALILPAFSRARPEGRFILAPPVGNGIGGCTRRQRPVAACFVNRNVDPLAAASGGIGV